MANDFHELREQALSGELFELIKTAIKNAFRFDLGTHKRTRLKQAGVAGSGSLLHGEVAKAHAATLAGELRKRAKRVGPEEANDRFRFMTVLQAVVEPDTEKVREAVEAMERDFNYTVGQMGVWSRGAIELEMVNLTILKKISELNDSEARKLKVLIDLAELEEFDGLMIPVSGAITRVLVHSHVVVDLGSDHENAEAELRKRIQRRGCWSKKYQVEIKGLFKSRKVADNLDKIAAYVTKGGNENLRYNAGFGRDLAEDVEAKMWRAGLGRADRTGETIEDERGLSAAEVQALDALYVWLMKRRKDNRGYIIGSKGSW
ncbi:hypothetical protein [Methylocystis sp. SB2]|uniref:hypothetical protein n=1 Tax=Methylocystis sp. (strain SB2) TaxID=743836 RepID=UPI0004A49043|nr:hypothetical protein [Methylocystis sp. SB2]ULO25084.1 hypothetical protein LNB28_06765 [Methylocystis sp. SB2]